MKPKAASYYKQNRLKQLRAFCYTAKSGSISKAAEQLYLSQPSVSLQIQALERELNTMLFERRGPKIRLTPDGQALLGTRAYSMRSKVHFDIVPRDCSHRDLWARRG